MMKSALTLALSLACWGVLLAEDPLAWRGLDLGESTPLEAIELLGPPEKDKGDVRLQNPVDRWLNRDQRYRRLKWKPEGYKKVRLYFFNDRLVSVEFEPQDLPEARELGDRYGLNMYPLVRGHLLTATASEFESVNRSRIALEYPALYHLVGVERDVVLVTWVKNTGWLKTLESTTGGAFGGDYKPGKAMRLQFIYRPVAE